LCFPASVLWCLWMVTFGMVVSGERGVSPRSLTNSRVSGTEPTGSRKSAGTWSVMSRLGAPYVGSAGGWFGFGRLISWPTRSGACAVFIVPSKENLMSKTAAEFFAGIGLVRMGLERTGWHTAFANEIDAGKFAMYRDYFGEDNFHLGDIRTVKPSTVPDVDLVTASFPCIDLSLAGNRGGLNANHSSTFWEFHRIIKGMRSRRPTLVLIENVVGLLNSSKGQDLRSIIVSLNKLGYSCDLLILDAIHFVPQSRPRLFIIGHLTGSASRTDQNGQRPHDVRPAQLLKFFARHSDLNYFHLQLPPLPPKRCNLADVMERLKDDSPEWWDDRRQAHLFGQMSSSHKKVLDT